MKNPKIVSPVAVFDKCQQPHRSTDRSLGALNENFWKLQWVHRAACPIEWCVLGVGDQLIRPWSKGWAKPFKESLTNTTRRTQTHSQLHSLFTQVLSSLASKDGRRKRMSCLQRLLEAAGGRRRLFSRWKGGRVCGRERSERSPSSHNNLEENNAYYFYITDGVWNNGQTRAIYFLFDSSLSCLFLRSRDDVKQNCNDAKYGLPNRRLLFLTFCAF